MARYSNRKQILIDGDPYRRVLSEKDRKRIVLYESPTFPEKTVEIVRQLNVTSYAWRMGDNYYKVAHDQYGDRDLWWVLAWYNGIPSDTYLRRGERIGIPRPVETVVSYFYASR